jgi:steroid delta-isomerase-like uncharacterized protein
MADLTAIAKEYFETFNRRDWDKMRSLLHTQYSYTGGDGQRMDGPDAGIGVAQMFAGAMSDAKITINRTYASGDVVVTEFTGSGTQDGAFMDIAATGRKVTMPVCNVIEMRDGKIYAEREYMDMAHMMQQLGVMPVPATA